MTSAPHPAQATQTASASTATAVADAPRDAPPSRGWTWLLAAGAVGLAAAAAMLVTNHVQTLGAGARPAVAAPSAVGAPQPLAPVAGNAEDRRVVPPAPAVSRPIRPPATVLPTVLQVAGQAQALAGDHVALPSGARFDLRITPPRAGQLEVYALSPAGTVPVLLWTGPAAAHAAVQTPMLRLEGRTGVERLRVLLRGSRGQVLGLHELRIWHI